MVRIVCKLNIFLIIIAMFIGVSANADDNTQHVWKYTPIPLIYGTDTGLVNLTESDENFNTYTVKQTTTKTTRCLYVRTENPLPANHKYFINVKVKSNFTNPPYFRFLIDGDYNDLRNISAYEPNKWLNLYKILTPTQDLQFTGNTNGILPYLNSYVAGETITIDKNGFLTMFDLTEMFGAGNEPTTVAAAIQALSIDTTIKIATTKYSEAQFAPVETRLDAAVAAVDTVVTQTMTQAQAIDTIATNKQTRPDEGCTAKYCLLVEDEDGTPHWYPIAGANGVAHNLPAGYTELQYIESTGTQYIDTGIIPTNRTSISAKATVLNLNSGPSFFGSLSGNPLVGLLLGTSSTGNGGLFVNKTTDALNIQITANSIYEINLSGTTLSIQKSGEQAQTFTTTPIVETAGNIYMIGRNEDGVVKRLGAFKYYYMKIYENGVLVRDFVPAKNSNNVVGMYDLADSNPATAFHTNAGTGTFFAGPDM